MSSRLPPQDTYARLLSSSRGYPLWTPEPSNELLMQRQEGLAIGDVGVVLEHGGVDVLFNLCLPPDHPFHLRHGVPQGFTCINKSRLDIMTITNAEPPSYAIHSSSVTPAKTPGSSNDVSETSNALPYRFDLSTSEGAALVLPKGAERYDLLNEELFLEQARQHGAAWYDYAVNRRGRRISPDSLYLITGAHKTVAWSAAVFENASADGHHTAYLRQIERNDYPPMYTWEATGPCSLEWRVAPDTGPHVEYSIPNQAVFIRGFKIAIRNGLLGTQWVSVEADSPSARSKNVKLSSVVPSGSHIPERLGGFLGAIFSNGSSSFPTTARSEGTIDAGEERPQSNPHRDGYDGTQIKIQRVPDGPRPFHPSDAINRYLLENNPSASIAISHDSHWISLLDNNSLTQEKLGDESSVQTVLCQNYRVVSRDGAVYLERKSSQATGCYPPFTSEQKATPAGSPQSSPSISHLRPIDVLDFPLAPQISVPSLIPQPESGDTVHHMHIPPEVRNLAWGQFQSNNTTESMHGDLNSREYHCLWRTNGQLCDILVRAQDVPEHFADSHAICGSNKTQAIICGWDGCDRSFDGRSLIHHIQEQHLHSTPESDPIMHHDWISKPLYVQIGTANANDLVNSDMPRQDPLQINDVTEPITGHRRRDELFHCCWKTNGPACGAAILTEELSGHLAAVHGVRRALSPTLRCQWGDCHLLILPKNLIRHIREKHLVHRRQSDHRPGPLFSFPRHIPPLRKSPKEPHVEPEGSN